MNHEIVKQAEEFMRKCTIENKAPAWELTEIAIHYGKLLAQEFKLNTDKLQLALYLAHCVFSNERGSEIMSSHTILSSNKARERLTDKDLYIDDINDICKAIELHHTTQDSGDLFCEVVKNAESFKFLTRK
jgi:phosphoribosyl 1,2-cyclic phosphodiesterase